jgi:hypothetical protein
VKVLLILKNHPRNVQICEELLKKYRNNSIDLVLMKGEDLLPNPPNNLPLKIQKLWKIHFSKRYEFENKYFNCNLKNLKTSINIYKEFDELTDPRFVKFLKNNNYDLSFISGIKIIPKNLMSLLPSYTINFHLGFIPYYKGTITTFWPFYFLEPHMLATTYHIIDEKVDTGEILHTSFPSLSSTDSLHESSCKAIFNGQSDIFKVFEYIKNRIHNKDVIIKDTSLMIQGKLFRNSDWKPEMLSFIYEVHKDQIVKNFYDKKLLINKKYISINESFEKKTKNFI